MFRTSFGDAAFAVCASGASGFTVTGVDFTMKAEYLDGPVRITAPKPTDGSSSCDVVEEPMEVTPIALAVLTGSAVPSASPRKLKASALPV